MLINMVLSCVLIGTFIIYYILELYPKYIGYWLFMLSDKEGYYICKRQPYYSHLKLDLYSEEDIQKYFPDNYFCHKRIYSKINYPNGYAVDDKPIGLKITKMNFL